MKKLQISLLSVFLVCLFTACQEDKVGFYEGAVAINMTLSNGDGTFVKGETDQEKTFKIKLAVQGEVADVDRVIKFGFGKEHTAVQGTNFDLPMQVTMEAGRLDTVIECKVYREGLTEEPLMCDLVIAEGGDFVGGVYDELLVKLMIGFPTQWVDNTGWAAGYALGKCTQAKYAFVFDHLGVIDISDYAGAYGYLGYMELANRLNSILADNPRLDDDGKTMKFGTGY